MRFQPFPRSTDCDSGLQYYTCSSSGYSGCCSVDACDYTDGCPDDSSSASSTASATSASSSQTSTSTTTSTKTFTAIETATITAPGTGTATGTITSVVTATASSTSVPTTTQSSTGKATLIGVVVAVVLFCLLVVLLLWWFCARRRRRQQQQQQQQAQNSGGPNLDLPSASDSPNVAGVLEKAEVWGDVSSPLSPNLQDGQDGHDGHDGHGSALEVFLARLGLQGTWLGALCKKQPSIVPPPPPEDALMHLPEMPSQTGPRAYVAELDALDAAVTPELESPALPQTSPPLSSVPEGEASTPPCVSPWYSSGTTAVAAMTPEVGRNRDSFGTSQRSPTERPKATLNITPQERMQGKHVSSWTSYQP